jgi:hypothetical protein
MTRRPRTVCRLGICGVMGARALHVRTTEDPAQVEKEFCFHHS